MIIYDCAPYHFIKAFPVKCEMSYKKYFISWMCSFQCISVCGISNLVNFINKEMKAGQKEGRKK